MTKYILYIQISQLKTKEAKAAFRIIKSSLFLEEGMIWHAEWI